MDREARRNTEGASRVRRRGVREMTEGVNASRSRSTSTKDAVRGVRLRTPGRRYGDVSGRLATGLLGVAEFGGSRWLMAPQITAERRIKLRGSRLATIAMTVAERALQHRDAA